MLRKFKIILTLLLAFICTANAQIVTTEQISNIEISSSTAKFLGKTKAVRDLPQKTRTSKEKKSACRRLKKVPDNFKGRKSGGKSVNKDLEHQGPDPIRQVNFGNKSSNNSRSLSSTPIVNVDGLGGFGTPHDPTGDVSNEHYVQAINVTDVGVYDLEGNLVQTFAMNTLWSSLGASSAGDPIILYDENAEKWFITEFTDPGNLLIAVSDTNDPLGSYNAYSFATPNFPDYPKYAITPTALVATTNEEGGGTLHQYFLDIEGLYAGANDVTMIRIGVTGNNGTEAGFYVSTPADWNGTNLPFDNRPITLAINDSSWPGGPAEDQIEIYSFNLDWDVPNNSTVDQTSIVTTPFDSYPCAIAGPIFQCIPQMGNGGGLDAIPEVVMNVPHLRNFGTHESLVFNFITDITNGQNVSGIRWVELRRTPGSDWSLYQEGTFGPEDGLHRFMGGIAIDDSGAIGLAYNVSSPDSYVGVRYTGRNANDPLGTMTLDEVNVIDGASTINGGFQGRFGDYPQLSVSPLGDKTFWFTTEYATNNDAGTRIVAFKLTQDTFDLQAESILEPITSSSLGNAELVTAKIRNTGINSMENFNVGLLLDGISIQTSLVPSILLPGEELDYQFTTPIDLSVIGDYNITVFVNHPDDLNSNNDTITAIVSKLTAIDGALSIATIPESGCLADLPVTLTLTNNGGNIITSASIDVIINGNVVETIPYTGNILSSDSDDIEYTIMNGLQIGNNTIEFAINQVNGSTDNVTTNNTTASTYDLTGDNEFVTLLFLTDNWPEENDWTITNSDTGAEVASGTLDGQEDATLVTTVICLDLDACYSIEVTDSAADGICCGFGEGNFQIVDNENNVLVFNNGEFGASVTEEFCPSAGCALTANIVVENATGTATADGSIVINNTTGAPGPYTYSIDGGASTQDSPVFENLVPGDYNVVVSTSDGGCLYEETVTIDGISGLYIINDKEVTVSISPNPTEGVFKINISNLDINDPLLKLEIIDVNGRFIQERTIGKYNNDYVGTISLYDFPNGHYFVRVANKGVKIIEKVVKNN